MVREPIEQWSGELLVAATRAACSVRAATTAHEAVHVVQQRDGVHLNSGVGEVGDEYRPSPLPGCRPPAYTLNHMVQFERTGLDAAFAAIADGTRRGVLEQLGRADASITELALKFDMTLTGMKKHVGVLEQAGLVSTEKVGRVRTCKLGPRRLEDETAWIERYQQLWASRFDELDMVLEELRRKEMTDGRKKRK